MLTAKPSVLRLARLTAGVTQIVIAQRARISPARLSLLERGYVEPDAKERAALAGALGIDEVELFPLSAKESSSAGGPALVPPSPSTH